MGIGKKLKTPYGDLIVKAYSYQNNGRLAILLYTEDGELFEDLTINLSNMMTLEIDEGFISSDIELINNEKFNIIDTLEKLNIIKENYGKKQYNIGRYTHVRFNLDVLKEYDSEGIEKFLKENS